MRRASERLVVWLGCVMSGLNLPRGARSVAANHEIVSFA